MNDSIKLKPCPFCGNKFAPMVCTIAKAENTNQEEYRYKFDSSHYLAVCDYMNGGCGASTGGMYTTPEAAAEAWNCRADSAEQ